MSVLSTKTKARVGLKTAKQAAKHPKLALRGARGAQPVVRGVVNMRTRQARHQAAAVLAAGQSSGRPPETVRQTAQTRPWLRCRGSGRPLGSPSASQSERARCTSWTRRAAASADAPSSDWSSQTVVAISRPSPRPTTRPGGLRIPRPDICPPSTTSPGERDPLRRWPRLPRSPAAGRPTGLETRGRRGAARSRSRG